MTSTIKNAVDPTHLQITGTGCGTPAATDPSWARRSRCCPGRGPNLGQDFQNAGDPTHLQVTSVGCGTPAATGQPWARRSRRAQGLS